MALDTRDKRSSAICPNLPWRIFPNPDGSWDQGDRQQVGLVYRGIDAGAATVPDNPGLFWQSPDGPFLWQGDHGPMLWISEDND